MSTARSEDRPRPVALSSVGTALHDENLRRFREQRAIFGTEVARILTTGQEFEVFSAEPLKPLKRKDKKRSIGKAKREFLQETEKNMQKMQGTLEHKLLYQARNSSALDLLGQLAFFKFLSGEDLKSFCVRYEDSFLKNLETDVIWFRNLQQEENLKEIFPESEEIRKLFVPLIQDLQYVGPHWGKRKPTRRICVEAMFVLCLALQSGRLDIIKVTLHKIHKAGILDKLAAFPSAYLQDTLTRLKTFSLDPYKTFNLSPLYPSFHLEEGWREFHQILMDRYRLEQGLKLYKASKKSIKKKRNTRKEIEEAEKLLVEGKITPSSEDAIQLSFQHQPYLHHSQNEESVLRSFLINGLDLPSIYQAYLRHPTAFKNLLQEKASVPEMLLYLCMTKWKLTKESFIVEDGCLSPSEVSQRQRIVKRVAGPHTKITEAITNSALNTCLFLFSPDDFPVERDLTLRHPSVTTIRRKEAEWNEKKIFYLYGSRPSIPYIVTHWAHSNGPLCLADWVQRLNEDMLTKAKGAWAKADLTRGIMSVPKVVAGNQQLISQNKPDSREKSCKNYDQVVMLRPMSGSVVWLDKEKRIYESSGSTDRYAHVATSLRKSVTIYGSSFLGFPNMKGWFTLNRSGVTGGILVIPDKDFDSMVFLLERGLSFFPQVMEHSMFARRSFPVFNGVKGDRCFGGREEQEQFRTAHRNTPTACAAFSVAMPNMDITTTGMFGCMFPEDWIVEGMKTLEQKLSKIKDNKDVEISLLCRASRNVFGCACVKYGETLKKDKAFISHPFYDPKTKTWDWKEEAEYEAIPKKEDYFPSTVCRVLIRLSTGGYLRDEFIGPNIKAQAACELPSVTRSMSLYEVFVNGFKPLEMYIRDHCCLISKRNAKDYELTGENLSGYRKEAEVKKWRELETKVTSK